MLGEFSEKVHSDEVIQEHLKFQKGRGGEIFESIEEC